MPLAIIESDAACSIKTPGGTAPMRIGYVIRNEIGQPVARVGQYVGEGTINQAEYLALTHALRHALRLGFDKATCQVDSQLLARQLSGQYRIKDSKLARLAREVRDLRPLFREVLVNWEPRAKNTEADELAHQTVFQQAPLPEAPEVNPEKKTSLSAWQARQTALWMEAVTDPNPNAIARVWGVHHNVPVQIAKGESYRGATLDGKPDLSKWQGELMELVI